MGRPQGAEEHIATWFHVGDDCLHAAARQSGERQHALVPGFTVAVCTYRRAASLKRLLESIESQERQPDQLLIVDASPDDAAEEILRQWTDLRRVARCTLYCRVRGPLVGLTRQRNFSLRNVLTDLVVFFDDDIVLLPGCLGQLERAHRTSSGTVGAAAYIGEFQPPWLIWRLRRLMGCVSSLRPGKYCRSGISIPWQFHRPEGKIVEGDYLAGGATMWRADVARELGFNEDLAGYALGEDLDFSLRARTRGKLVLVDDARVLHLHEAAGRPDWFQFGYMDTRNHYEIHKRALRDRTGWDVAWFAYSWFVDTVLLNRLLLVPGLFGFACRLIAGRLRAAWDLTTGAAAGNPSTSGSGSDSRRVHGEPST